MSKNRHFPNNEQVADQQPVEQQIEQQAEAVKPEEKTAEQVLQQEQPVVQQEQTAHEEPVQKVVIKQPDEQQPEQKPQQQPQPKVQQPQPVKQQPVVENVKKVEPVKKVADGKVTNEVLCQYAEAKIRGIKDYTSLPVRSSQQQVSIFMDYASEVCKQPNISYVAGRELARLNFQKENQ